MRVRCCGEVRPVSLACVHIGLYMTALKAIVGVGAVILASHGFHFYRRSREDELMEVYMDVQDRAAFYKSRHDQIAATYDADFESYEWSKRIHKFRGVLLSYAEGKVLEIGVGTGRNWPYYPKECHIVGIDWSSEMLKESDKKASGLKHLILMQMDGRKVKFPDDTFDTVVATFALSSCPDPDLMLAEMVRVCRPRGKILLLDRGMGMAFLGNTLLEMYRYEYLMEYGYDQCLDVEEVVRKAAVEVEVEEHKHGGQLHFYLLRPRKS